MRSLTPIAILLAALCLLAPVVGACVAPDPITLDPPLPVPPGPVAPVEPPAPPQPPPAVPAGPVAPSVLGLSPAAVEAVLGPAVDDPPENPGEADLRYYAARPQDGSGLWWIAYRGGVVVSVEWVRVVR